MFNMFINNLRRYIHFVVGTFVILVLMYLLNELKNYNLLKLAIENGRYDDFIDAATRVRKFSIYYKEILRYASKSEVKIKDKWIGTYKISYDFETKDTLFIRNLHTSEEFFIYSLEGETLTVAERKYGISFITVDSLLLIGSNDTIYLSRR